MLLHIVRVIFILLEVLILFNLLIVVHELKDRRVREANYRKAEKSDRGTNQKNASSHAHRSHRLTMRMSRDEQRVNDARTRDQCDRAARHWLNPLVGL